MSTPLTDSINALTAYANETTGAEDTTLSDAVGRLCEGYGGGSELYPVGTDLVTAYVGRNLSDGQGLFIPGSYSTKTGEPEEGDFGISLEYIPVDPNYEYYKTDQGRLYILLFYDENKNYISGISYPSPAMSLVWAKLPSFPINTRYIRIATHVLVNNWDIAIYRTA